MVKYRLPIKFCVYNLLVVYICNEILQKSADNLR